MEEGGFPPEKLYALHNFIDKQKLVGAPTLKKDHYCYVGRLSEEKGVRTLLKVASKLPYTLKVLGTGPLEAELRATYVESRQIEFLGHCAWETIRTILGEARCMVLPSEWYENNPLSVLEAISLGTPVIGADIGGIPELVVPGRTGSLFESGNETQLSDRICELINVERYVMATDNPPMDSFEYCQELTKVYHR